MLTVGELAIFLKASASRVRPELTTVTREFLDDTKQVARSLIGEENNGWAPLAERTVEEKKMLGYSGQVSATDPLLRTGEMRESIRSEAEETGLGVDGVIGSTEKVALWQEMGTTGSDRHKAIPPRPFLATALRKELPKAEEEYGTMAIHLLKPTLVR